LEAFNDSINELGFTRGKNGGIDLTSLLKSPKVLEDDGIEDLHFHQVAFNRHRGGILEKLEREQARKLRKMRSSKGDKKSKNKESSGERLTVELVSEEEDIIN